MLLGNNQLFSQAKFEKQIPWAEQGVWLKADTHIHTIFSDGKLSILEVTSKARKHGCDVIAITDHTDRNMTAATLEYAEAIRVARRTFPDLIILSGVEWNVPPFGGDHHISVLLSEGPDEFDLLREFKYLFDDFQREGSNPELADQALQWLQERLDATGLSAALILNHPSRKVSQTSEVYDMIKQWRSVNDLVVGMEGAPGHQKSETNGSYSGAIKTVERWDPVVASPGEVWDQLLSEGHDLSGAIATSDFHNTDLDYWPGEFSETWLYAPERSSIGALAAIKQGSFFGCHGHIAKQVELTVWASGLNRSAYPGEVISVPAGETVLVRLACEVSDTDYEGKASFLDELTIISGHKNEVTPISKKQIFLQAASIEAEFEVSLDGLFLRGVGKKANTSNSLMFLTNAVHVKARPAFGYGIFTLPKLKHILIWSVCTLLLIILVWRLKRRKSQKHVRENDSIPLKREVQNGPNTQFDVDWSPPTSEEYKPPAFEFRKNAPSNKQARQIPSDNQKSNLIPLFFLLAIWLPAVIIASSPKLHDNWQLPYNVAELLDGRPILIVSLFVLATAGVGFVISFMSLQWAIRPRTAAEIIPAVLLLTLSSGFILIKSSLPLESINDVLGDATITLISPDVEQTLRFTWTAIGLLIPLIVGARLVRGRFEAQSWRIFVSFFGLLIVSELFVIHWSETDNITELLRLSDRVLFRFSFLAFFIYLGLLAQLLGTSLSSLKVGTIFKFIIVVVVGVPVCWTLLLCIFTENLTKYGYNYSGIQFLVSPSREEILSHDEIFYRLLPMYSFSVCLLGVGAAIGERFFWFLQRILSELNSISHETTVERFRTKSRFQSTRKILLPLSILYFFLIVAGSLVPLNFTPLSFPLANNHFHQVLEQSIDFEHLFDWVTNVLLFIPFGFMLMGIINKKSVLGKFTSAILITLFCCELSASIEYTQLWFPPRVVSKNDILAETFGGGIGVLLWIVFGQASNQFLHKIETLYFVHKPLGRALIGYCLFLIAYSLMPLDLTIAPSELHDKWKMGRFELIPFSFFARPLAGQFLSLLVDFWVYLPLGALLSMHFHNVSKTHSLRRVAAISFVMVLISESIQIFVFSRNVGASDMIVALCGSLCGANLVSLKNNNSPESPLLDSTTKYQAVSSGLLFCFFYSGVYLFLSVGDVGPIDSSTLINRLADFWNLNLVFNLSESPNDIALLFVWHFFALVPLGYVIPQIVLNLATEMSVLFKTIAVISFISIIIAFLEVFQAQSKDLTPSFFHALILILGLIFGLVLRARFTSACNYQMSARQIAKMGNLLIFILVAIATTAGVSYRQIHMLKAGKFEAVKRNHRIPSDLESFRDSTKHESSW